jgi:uncharacterized MAPEG superfamily protein
MKRIKHNDLLPWFTDDHRDLPPASYLKPAARNFLRDSLKPRAAKQRAASVKQQATNRKEKMLEIFIIFTSLFILNMLGVFTVTI